MCWSNVLEYAERFEQAKHGVLVHNRDIGEVFFVQKFIDGIKHNISRVITLHKPRTVHVSLSLTLMQEQLLEESTQRFSTRVREYNKSVVKSSSAYNPVVKQMSAVLRSNPGADKGQVEKQNQQAKVEGKWETLKAKREASGLCMECGKQYNPQHRCPKQVTYMWWKS
jgi:hypothetical protein